MKSPRYTAGVVSIYRKYVDRYLEQGRDGYFVEPEDRKMLLDLFDRGGFTDGYCMSTMDGAYGCAGGNRNSGEGKPETL